MKDSHIDIRIIPTTEIATILPLLTTLNDGNVSEEILTQRMHEMVTQNYECAGVYDDKTLIGICGLWFQTRHYAGRSIEMDHVIINASYRSQGLGSKLLDFVYAYAKSKQCRWVELNTYVHNFPSHKFYNNHGFAAKGYHFVKDITV